MGDGNGTKRKQRFRRYKTRSVYMIENVYNSSVKDSIIPFKIPMYLFSFYSNNLL